MLWQLMRVPIYLMYTWAGAVGWKTPTQVYRCHVQHNSALTFPNSYSVRSGLPSPAHVNVTLPGARFKLLVESAQLLRIHLRHTLFLPFLPGLIFHDLHEARDMSKSSNTKCTSTLQSSATDDFKVSGWAPSEFCTSLSPEGARPSLTALLWTAASLSSCTCKAVQEKMAHLKGLNKAHRMSRVCLQENQYLGLNVNDSTLCLSSGSLSLPLNRLSGSAAQQLGRESEACCQRSSHQQLHHASLASVASLIL